MPPNQRRCVGDTAIPTLYHPVDAALLLSLVGYLRRVGAGLTDLNPGSSALSSWESSSKPPLARSKISQEDLPFLNPGSTHRESHMRTAKRAATAPEDSYEYIALGEYVVVAPGVCGGRPTFKGTRLEVSVILDLMAAGWSVARILDQYRTSALSAEAIGEAVRLAAEALRERTNGIAA